MSSSSLKTASNLHFTSVDLCIAAALDTVKGDVRLPRRITEAPVNGAHIIIPSTFDVLASTNGAHVLAIDAVDASGVPLTMADPVSESTNRPHFLPLQI